MKALKIELAKQKKWFLLFFISILGIWLLGVSVQIVMLAGFKETTTVTLGTLFICPIAPFMHAFKRIFSFGTEFNMAIAMGQTRKKYVWTYELVALLELICAALLGYVLCLSEKAICNKFFSQVSIEIDAVAVFQLRYLIPAILGILVLEVFLQAMSMRFGMKAFWAIWLMWMIICLGPTMGIRTRWIEKTVTGIAKGVLKLTEQTSGYIWIFGGLILGAVLLIISWGSLRKQRVTA